ncbi:hypothetical protein EYZ11_009116 [Aspergillus tanneri]|uniref:Letm1 RBD domain-containing protein n=1 Tax=Aspergillus tanneri TaxID=1220188 RepID=A0A4S3J966_9EURO|nr:uncharacterized protein ATNIH1004_006910 [Aspergillus tanneri]KAA8645491.1 hypothetical protein ATNIH1004_006910 [Aspergillus tanneri]THC91425.1 hypothetical protein EYZ11_009116 [Aspergillus tanneri]
MSASLCPHRVLLGHSLSPSILSITSLRRREQLLTSRRHAHSSSSKTHTRPSSSAQPVTSTVPSTTTTATTSLANDVNPPPSTRPADLNLPNPIVPSAAATEKLKRFISMGRAYLSFYKTGLKNVYHNYRASIPLRSSLGINPYLPISPPPPTKHGKAFAAFDNAVRTLPLSRSNFQLIRRAAYDFRRMVPFTLMLIVCGELTPLVILALGSAIVPFTCRIPRQVEKDRALHIARKRAAMTAHELAATGFLTPVAVGSEQELDLLVRMYAHPAWIETASAEEILRACAALGLVKSHTRPVALVSLLYRDRLRRYAEYLNLDDRLIRKCGGVKELEAAEVRIAVEERGGVGIAQDSEGWDAERVERRWLERWLERRVKQ